MTMSVPGILSTSNIAYLLWTGVILGLLHIQTCIGCPDDAVTHVYACLGNLVGEDGKIKVLAGDDADEFYQKCLDGSFDITIHCVQNVLTQCRGTPQENALKKTLDPDVMKKAFDTACEKKEHYLKTAACVSGYKDRIQTCCKSMQRQFIAAKDEAYTKEKYMDLMCRLYCDAVTARTIVDFMSGVTPVTCIPYSNKAPDRTLPSVLSLVFLILLLWIYVC